MADAPEIKVKLTAEDTGVSAAIKELGNQLKNLKRTQDETSASSLNLSKAFQGIAVGAAALSVVEFGKSVFQSATEIARASQITGASAKTLGVFHKAASDLGISGEVIDKSFVKLSKSILAFQQGNSQAAQAFAQLHISLKDLEGLNTDQKIKLVTDRLGGMAAGTNRAALAQQLLGRGGAEALPVLQSLAGDGFAKVQEEAEKMGLLFDDQTAGSILAMQKQLADLKDEAVGAATQFEVGLIPAVSDAASAIVQAINGGGAGGGFKELGKEVGDLVKDVTYGLIVDGAKAAEVIAETEVIWHATMDNMSTAAKSAWAGIKGYFKDGMAGAVAAASDTVAATSAGRDAATQIAAIEKQFEQAKEKANFDVFGGSGGVAPAKPKGDEGAGGVSPALEAASKAKLSLDEKAAENKLAIDRATATQAAEIDKQQYDAGLISLSEYYERRKAAIIAGTNEEIQILRGEMSLAKAAAQKAGADAKKAPTDQEADKLNAEKLQNLAKVSELETRISELQIAAQTKIAALDDERNAKATESQQQTLAFEKELAQLQGKRQETTKAEIDAEEEKRKKQIAQSGVSDQEKAKLTAELEQWKQLKLAVAAYEDAREKTKQDTQSFDIQKQGIENQQKAGQISPLEAEREINQLIKDRLPLLKADAEAELGAAQKTGNQDNIAQATQDKAKLNEIALSAKDLGRDMGQSLTSDFTTFFETVGRGTQSVAQSFEKLASSVIMSIEKMLVKMLLLKIASAGQAATGGAGGTGFLSGIFAGIAPHAEGGLIKGPGGPKDDRIPAMLSHGEFVVKADAVASFGAHNLDAINRGLKIPSLSQLALPKFAEGGLVGHSGVGGESGSIKMGITLDKGLILEHLSSKQAGRIILDHITNNPKAASKALGRSQG